MPPLRERREDIPPLVRHFTQQFARRMNKRIETIPTEAMDALSRYHWPGNIRELENVIERAVILSRGPTLHVPLAELKERHGRCARRNVSTLTRSKPPSASTSGRRCNEAGGRSADRPAPPRNSE